MGRKEKQVSKDQNEERAVPYTQNHDYSNYRRGDLKLEVILYLSQRKLNRWCGGHKSWMPD
jgi:hypothetical protein